jgi:hypothetical protein
MSIICNGKSCPQIIIATSNGGRCHVQPLTVTAGKETGMCTKRRLSDPQRCASQKTCDVEEKSDEQSLRWHRTNHMSCSGASVPGSEWARTLRILLHTIKPCSLYPSDQGPEGVLWAIACNYAKNDERMVRQFSWSISSTLSESRGRLRT